MIQADATEAVRAIKEIGGVISRINDIRPRLPAAVEEQSATTNEIGRNVAEAGKGSAEIAENITLVAGSAQQTSEGVSNTRNAGEELAGMAAELQQLVNHFCYETRDTSETGSRRLVGEKTSAGMGRNFTNRSGNGPVNRLNGLNHP